MPDYYSSLASHYLNIWVDFESYEQNNLTNMSKSESVNNMHHKVCLIVIINNFKPIFLSYSI